MRMCVCMWCLYVQAVIERGSLVGTAGACVAQGKGCEGGMHVYTYIKCMAWRGIDRRRSDDGCMHVLIVCAGYDRVWQAQQGPVQA